MPPFIHLRTTGQPAYGARDSAHHALYCAMPPTARIECYILVDGRECDPGGARHLRMLEPKQLETMGRE